MRTPSCVSFVLFVVVVFLNICLLISLSVIAGSNNNVYDDEYVIRYNENETNLRANPIDKRTFIPLRVSVRMNDCLIAIIWPFFAEIFFFTGEMGQHFTLNISKIDSNAKDVGRVHFCA